MPAKNNSEAIVRDIKRKTRKRYNAEEKIRIVLDGLRGEESIAAICRREGISSNLYYRWSKDFLEAGKRRLLGDIQREATSTEVTSLKQENDQLKQLVAELSAIPPVYPEMNLLADTMKSIIYKLTILELSCINTA